APRQLGRRRAQSDRGARARRRSSAGRRAQPAGPGPRRGCPPRPGTRRSPSGPRDRHHGGGRRDRPGGSRGGVRRRRGPHASGCRQAARTAHLMDLFAALLAGSAAVLAFPARAPRRGAERLARRRLPPALVVVPLAVLPVLLLEGRQLVLGLVGVLVV